MSSGRQAPLVKVQNSLIDARLAVASLAADPDADPEQVEQATRELAELEASVASQRAEYDALAEKVHSYPLGPLPVVGPVTARDLHHRLIEWWGVSRGEWVTWLRDGRKGGRPVTEVLGPVEGLERRQVAWLRAAETFLVTEEMAAVARAACATLPEDVTVRHELLPAEAGFVVFGGYLVDVDVLGGTSTQAANAAAWRLGAVDGQPGVVVALYALPQLEKRALVSLLTWGSEFLGEERARQAEVWVDRFGAPLLLNGWMFLPFGGPVVSPAESRHSYYARAAQMLLATWLLMEETLLTVRERPDLPRPRRRAQARAGMTRPGVTVVTLRRPRHAAEHPGEGGRTYSSRWLVRGHWRRVVRRDGTVGATWVRAHEKGPDGAPLVIRDRVTVLAR